MSFRQGQPLHADSADSLRYLPQLDGARALAVGLVLMLHCVKPPSQGTTAWLLKHGCSMGWIGVDLFFALSGFLITRILVNAKDRPHYFRNFYARRFLRIFPLYYAVLGALWFLGPILLPFGAMEPAWPYFTYLSNLPSVLGSGGWPPLAHTWSLAVEEQYYLVFPLLVMFLDRARLRIALWMVVVLSPAARLAALWYYGGDATHFLTICRLDVLAMGGLAGLAYESIRDGSPERLAGPRRAFLVLLVLAALMFATKQLDFSKVSHNLVGATLVDALCAIFVFLVARSAWGWMDACLRFPAVVGLGKVSYGVYLVHFPILYFVDIHVSALSGDTWWRTLFTACGSISLTVLIASLSWRFFERPILGAKRFFADPPALPAARENCVS